MRRIKLTKYEKEVENTDYVDVPKEEFDRIVKALAEYRKDAVLNIRINSQDLRRLKEKAQKLGVKYQTLISKVLHHVAMR